MQDTNELLALIAKLEAENAELRGLVEVLTRQLFGKKSEKRSSKIATGNAGDEATRTPAPRKPKKKTPGHGRAPFPEHLPRKVITHDLPKSELRCDTCEKELVLIGEDTCERGNIEPVTITICCHVSRKYGCPDGHMIKTAAGAPDGLVPRAKWTTATYSFVATSKFADHIPLDRLESMLKRQGIKLPKSTMSDMVQVVSKKVAPIIEQIRGEILAESHIQADETRLDFVLEGNQGVKRGYLWAWRAKKKLLFEFDPSRKGAAAKRFLGSWTGVLQVDGYDGYNAVVLENKITRAGCWAHGRRKFNDAAELKSENAEHMVALIARLYWIESAVRKRIVAKCMTEDQGLELLRRIRVRRSRTAVSRIKIVLDDLKARPEVLPKSPLGKAVTYMANQWATLTVFLGDPEVAIDNNATERAIRPIAIGRKNWMLAGSPRGAEAAARIYSIINTCKAIDVDPFTYLADVLDKVSPHADLEQLTPWAWKAVCAAAPHENPAEQG